MKFYTQKVDGYIGDTKWTVRSYGCLGTCFGMILEVNPREIFNHAEYFNSDGLLTNPQKLCDDFGGIWNTSRSDIGLRPVIVETRFDTYQHFIVWDGNRFWDPLSTDGHPLRDYKIISFRNVRKDDMIPQNLVDGRLYNSDGKVLYWIPDHDTASKYFGDWSNQKPITDLIAPVIKEVIKEVEKIVEVKIPVEIVKEIIKQVELTDEQKQVLTVWERIKVLLNKVRDFFTGKE